VIRATIASIKVKPCGENVAHWSTGQLPTEPRSATQPISFTSYFSLPPVRSSPFSKGSFPLVGRQAYSAHSTA
jgi:hypothetical protein